MKMKTNVKNELAFEAFNELNIAAYIRDRIKAFSDDHKFKSQSVAIFTTESTYRMLTDLYTEEFFKENKIIPKFVENMVIGDFRLHAGKEKKFSYYGYFYTKYTTAKDDPEYVDKIMKQVVDVMKDYWFKSGGYVEDKYTFVLAVSPEVFEEIYEARGTYNDKEGYSIRFSQDDGQLTIQIEIEDKSPAINAKNGAKRYPWIRATIQGYTHVILNVEKTNYNNSLLNRFKIFEYT